MSRIPTARAFDGSEVSPRVSTAPLRQSRLYRTKREPRRRRHVTLDLHELPDCNGESANRKTEYDERDAGAHPSKKRALIRKVIGDAIGVFACWGRVDVGCWSRHTSSERRGG